MFLAIDPGRNKCGWALFTVDGHVVDRGIWPRPDLRQNLTVLGNQQTIERIVLGDRTGHQALVDELSSDPTLSGRLFLVDEHKSSEEARRRYVKENTRGWRRLIPASLRSPDRPYDDYVAVILAERYLHGEGSPVSGRSRRPEASVPADPGQEKQRRR